MILSERKFRPGEFVLMSGREVCPMLCRILQNISCSGWLPACVQGRQALPVTRNPSGQSHRHVPEPHKKALAATDVFHDGSNLWPHSQIW